MITGELRSKIDAIWNTFWTGGISNPLEVIEQITYLLFLRRLDDLHTLEENKSARLKRPMERRVFPEGKDALRWSRFKNQAPAALFATVADQVFPFLRTMGGADSTYARHMKDARFTIPTPALLAKVVDLIDQVPMEDRDTKGDLYEYMLGKVATAGTNGQFRTPRHIIRLMVELVAPGPKDVICDPASGTCGFLVAANEYLRQHHPQVLTDAALKKHFHEQAFHGFDFDNTMLRIGSMNMLLHGVENPDVRYRDSLAQDHAGEEDKYTVILANPPFAGSLDYESTAKDLQKVVKTKKTELLFLALFLRLLKAGGRAAVIVPDGVLFGSSKAHKELRRMLVEDHKLDAVISLPGGVFRPYAGVSTAILCFTKTNSGGTDRVWFYDCDADGWSLDDKRNPLLDEAKLGPVPAATLTAEEHAKNNLPDILTRWRNRGTGVPPVRGDEKAHGRDAHATLASGTGVPPVRGNEKAHGQDARATIESGTGVPPVRTTDHGQDARATIKSGTGVPPVSTTDHGQDARATEEQRPRTAQSFLVSKADLKAQDYDLSINRYKEVVHAEVQHRAPKEILKELATLEEEIQREMKALEGMLG